MAIDSAEFRKVLGHFATGVTLVTTRHEGALQAMTVNSFSSVSLEPPLVLFCADKRSRTNSAVQGAGVFAVNILSEAQRPISDLFAGKGTDAERAELLGAAGAAVTGSPILGESLGFLDCKVTQTIDAGDHVIYLGEVVATGRAETGPPLLYYRGSYQALDEAWRWRDRYDARAQATLFGEMVDFFDRMQAEGPYATLLDELVVLADPGAEARCLDIGCGAGRLTRELAMRCASVVGVDTSKEMIERATQRAAALDLRNVAYREAPATGLPFDDGAFQLVTASNLLLHLLDPAAALAEAARVLAPEGKLAFLEPSPSMTRAAMAAYLGTHHHSPSTRRALLAWADAVEVGIRHSEEKLLAALDSAGFEATARERRLGDLALLWIARKR